jgi:predicted amidophosphoribosyltransferase
MQLVEIALFAAVAALALTLIGYAVRPYLRAKRRATGRQSLAELPAVPRELAPRPQAMVCPACHRDYAPGLRFCPHDARDLVPASDPAARAAGTGSTCPTCRRSYDAGKKFCALDGEELVPLPLAMGAGDPAGAVAVAFAGGLGKICPNCSRRYESEATFCGRDGEELVPVN